MLWEHVYLGGLKIYSWQRDLKEAYLLFLKISTEVDLLVKSVMDQSLPFLRHKPSSHLETHFILFKSLLYDLYWVL